MTIKPSEEDKNIAGTLAAGLVASMQLSDFGASAVAIDNIAQAITTARMEEREACAKLCETRAERHDQLMSVHDEEADCYEAQEELNKKQSARSCAKAIRSQS